MTTIKRKGKPALPQFYKRPVALNVHGHRHAGIRVGPGYAFARSAISVPLRASEFAAAAADYPIVFSDKGGFAPLAALGCQAGRNLFVDQDGAWQSGAYLPLYVRRYPFIGMGPSGAAEMSLAIDTGSGFFAPRAQPGRHLRLFDDEGGLTAVVRAGLELCVTWNGGQNNTMDFVQALTQAQVLEPGRLSLKFASGRTQAVDGFLQVGEPALRALPESTTALWRERGWLELIDLHLASQRHWPRLAAQCT
jgi:hypothetical protein